MSRRHVALRAVAGACLLAIALLVQAPPAAAQSRWALPSGARIRLHVVDSIGLSSSPLHPRTVIGTVTHATRDSVYLSFGGAEREGVRLHDVQSAYTSGGRSRIESALAFALVGGMLFAGASTFDGPDQRGLLFGGRTGLAVGALVGLLRPYEQWDRLEH